ncbi:MAG: sodium:calcium antiporter [Actinomycetales bacterium]|nr:sodium:calcium antiporter [Actinomycetales bacterium]
MLGWVLLAGAAVLLVVGAELFVENVAGAARGLGLTVLATGVLLAGAEPEEMLTGILASAGGRPELAAGDAVGANVTMLTVALGLAAVLRPLPVGRRVRGYAVGAAAAGLLAVCALADGTVSRWDGGGLVAVYVGLVTLVWWREREPPAVGELAEEAGEDRRSRAPRRGIALAVVGVVVMGLGGNLAIRGASRVVDSLGVTDSAVGLTALALATTAELFALAFAAVRRDVPEVAVAGVVGSAVYNATVSLGVAALVHPLRVGGVLGAAVAAAVLPLAVVVLSARGRLTRPAGAVLVAGYAAFLLVVLVGT